MSKPCKDCGPGSKRPAPHPGPRCATHHREYRRSVKARSASTRLAANHEMTDAEYEALYWAQGGRCWICQRATGASRRLSVDHDHKLNCGHDPKRSCRKCWRGLLCRRCNDLLGHVHDQPEALARAYWYLLNPPARSLPIPEQRQPTE